MSAADDAIREGRRSGLLMALALTLSIAAGVLLLYACMGCL